MKTVIPVYLVIEYLNQHNELIATLRCFGELGQYIDAADDPTKARLAVQVLYLVRQHAEQLSRLSDAFTAILRECRADHQASH